MTRPMLLTPFILIAATAAWAQSPPPAPKLAKPVKEKLVCEDEEQIGSRLGGHRVCKSAAQWADERQQTRMTIDRSQTERGCRNGSGGC